MYTIRLKIILNMENDISHQNTCTFTSNTITLATNRRLAVYAVILHFLLCHAPVNAIAANGACLQLLVSHLQSTSFSVLLRHTLGIEKISLVKQRGLAYLG